MILQSDNAFSSNHALDAAGSNRRIKVRIIAGCGYQAIDFYLARAMNILAVTQIDAHMRHTARLLVTEEEQITGLILAPVGAFLHYLSSESLL